MDLLVIPVDGHDQALLREDQGYSAEANRRNPAVSLLGGVGRDQLGGAAQFSQDLGCSARVVLLNGQHFSYFSTYPAAEEDPRTN